MKCEYFTPLAYILHVCTIYNPICVNFVHVTTLHLDVPLMGRQQIEAPWTFDMALAYFCDINRLLCNKVCVQMNLLCATYCLLPSMVFQWPFQGGPRGPGPPFGKVKKSKRAPLTDNSDCRSRKRKILRYYPPPPPNRVGFWRPRKISVTTPPH